MNATATQAVIPKARGMFAKRIAPAEYEEMMRRRNVTELAAMLKRHPYFGGSLNTLSTAAPHRGQIEELLNLDLFSKFEALERYDFSGGVFTGYFITECEVREVLKVLHLLSIGLPGAYLAQVPPYLAGKTSVDLFRLGRATNFADVVELCRGTLWYKTLRARFLADPALRDFPLTEAALLRQFYADVFRRIREALSGREAQATRELFLQQVEIYNLEVTMRIKLYFAAVYPPETLRRLLLPYRFRLSRGTLDAMVEATGPEELLGIYRRSAAVHYTGNADPDELAASGGRRMYEYARRMLHLTASPAAALASFLCLARLERENVVTVVEGVRYGLPPERIRLMLRF